MSTQVIDEKVVEMRFDNQQFEKGVKQSMSSIDKLKESLNFSGASKSFNQITEAANNVSFRGLEKNIDGLHDYVSLKAMAMFTVVNNMVSQIQTSVTNMVKQFTIVPLSTGFEEYELKMGSVQTIMAATGETLGTVNKYLEELNEYSDKTIYSFSDMTQNIGKFTNAGVKLEDAVLAMKGISNEAAVSGANANEASRAMYNLAQSLSMGYVQYIDWKSIENANMATVDFKNNLANMAVQLGVIKKSSDGYFEVAGKSYNLQQLFKDALKDQWLTTDVLIGTLRDYADETTEIGKKAYAAAQDVKTFTMMMDTLKEAVQSGWAYTWEIVIGDFNQAKEMFTKFANMFGEMIDNAAKARNTMLRAVLGSKWEQLTNQIQEAGISVEAFESRLTQALRDNGIPIDKMIEQWGSLGEAIKHIGNVKDYVIDVIKSFTEPMHETGEVVGDVTNKLEGFQKVVNQVIRGEFGSGAARIKKLTDAGWNYAQVQQLVNKVYERNGKTWKDTTITINDLIDVLGEMSTEQLEQAGITEEEVSALQRLKEEAELTGSNLNELIENLYKPEGRDLIFDSIRNAVEAVRVAFGTIKGAWLEVFPQRTTEELYGIIEALHKFSEFLIMDEKTADNLRRTLRGVFSVVGLIKDIITTALRVLFPGILDFTGDVAGGLLGVTATVGDAIYAFREFINEGTALEDIVLYLKDAFFAGIDAIKEWIEQFKEIPFVKSIIEGFLGMIEEFVKFAKNLVGDFYDGMAADNANLIDVVSKIGTKIINKLKSLIKLIPKVTDLHDIFSSMFEDFKSSGGNVVLGFIEGLVDGISDAIKMIIQFAVDVVNAFKEKLGIASPSKVFIWLGAMCVAGLVAGIVGGISSIKNAVTGMGTTLEDTAEKSIVKTFLDKLVNYFKEGTAIIIDVLNDFGAKLKDFLGKVKDFIFSDEYLPRIMDIIDTIMEVIITLKGAKALDSAGEMFENIGEGFKKMTGSISGFFKSASLLPVAYVAKSLAIAIGILLGVVWAMTKTLNEDEIKKAQIILEMVKDLIIYFGAIIGVVGAINIISNAVGKSATGKGGSSIASTIASLASMVGAIGFTLIGLSTIVKQLGSMQPSEISKAMSAIGEFLRALLVISTLTGLLGVVSKVNLFGTAATVLAIALALKMIIDIINKFFYTDKDGVKSFNAAKSAELMNAFSSLFWVIVTLVGSMAVISLVLRGVTSKTMGAAALTILALSFSVKIIVDSLNTMIKSFDKLDSKTIDYRMQEIVSILGFISLLTIAIMFVASKINPTALTGAALNIAAFGAGVFLILAGFIGMVIAFQNLTPKEIDTRLQAIVTLIVLIGGIVAALMVVASKNTLSFGKSAMLDMAALLVAIAGSLWILTKIVQNNQLDKILIAAGVLLGITLILSLIMAKIGTLGGNGLASTSNMIAMAIAIGAIAYSLYQLRDVDTDKILVCAAAITLMAGALEVLSAYVSTSFVSAVVILAIGAAVWVLAGALIKLGEVNADNLVKPIMALIVVLLIVAGVIGIIMALLSSPLAGALVLAVALFAAVAVSVWLLVDALVKLSENFEDIETFMEEVKKSTEKLTQAFKDLNGESENFKWTDLFFKYYTIEEAKASDNPTLQFGGALREDILDMWTHGGFTSKKSAVAEWFLNKNKKPEVTITEGGGSVDETYAPHKIEVHTLERSATKEAEETGAEIGSRMGAKTAEEYTKTMKESKFQRILGIIPEKPVKEAGEKVGEEAGTTTARSWLDSVKGIINNATEEGNYDIDSLTKSLTDTLNLEEMSDVGSIYNANLINGMFEGLEGTELEGYKDIFSDKLKESGLDEFFVLEGENANNNFWKGYTDQNAYNVNEMIPVISGNSISDATISGVGLTDILANSTASGYAQTVEFPDTMTVNNPGAIEAINALKQDIFNLGERISNLYVRLDTGIMVGTLTPYINQNMGRMAEYKGRGN